MTPQTDKALRALLWTLVIWLWLPLLTGLATAITYVLWVTSGRDWS